MQKNRNQTRAAMLDAVGRLLGQSGFKELGVNAIAREAGVDKVLIYRYFGGLAELLKAFAEETDFWPDLPELAREADQAPIEMTKAEQTKLLVVAFSRALRERPLTQEIMRWELLERNELTDALARHREKQSAKLFEYMDELEKIDMRAVGSLLAAGLTYLTLRSKTADTYNGLDLNSEHDWLRLEQAATFLVDAAMEKGDCTKAKKPIKTRPKDAKKQTR